MLDGPLLCSVACSKESGSPSVSVDFQVKSIINQIKLCGRALTWQDFLHLAVESTAHSWYETLAI